MPTGLREPRFNGMASDEYSLPHERPWRAVRLVVRDSGGWPGGSCSWDQQRTSWHRIDL